MCIRLFACILVHILAVTSLAAPDARARRLVTRADKYLSAAARAGKFSGSVLVARGGRVLISNGYGMASLELRVPNTPRTKFRLGSLTMTLPSTAAQPAEQSKPCGKEHRQFDFWVGEWDVTAQGQKIATSKISLLEGGCIVLEQYTQRDGYTGQSFNYYNPALGKWRQIWVDRGGNISEFSGEYKDGAMRYEGVSNPPGQDKVLRRMNLFNLGRDKVRQLSYRSTDDGRTWNVNYDFLYVRKK